MLDKNGMPQPPMVNSEAFRKGWKLVFDMKKKLKVRWQSPKDGCIRLECYKTMKAARARVAELARGHIVSEIWEYYS